MNAQIARLEELLTRIQKNRQAPRAPLAGAASQASGQVAAPEAAPAVDQAPARSHHSSPRVRKGTIRR